jgi:hypothetical protein
MWRVPTAALDASGFAEPSGAAPAADAQSTVLAASANATAAMRLFPLARFIWPYSSRPVPTLVRITRKF